MISLEDVVKWGAVALPVATAVVGTTLFFLYRSDYIRAGHPEPTLLAARLTASTLMNWARLRRGEKRVTKTGHARAGDDAPHEHKRKTDFGTVNRPIDGIEGLKEAIESRKTPTHHKRHSDHDDSASQ